MVREITLKQLCMNIIKKYKLIVLCMVIGVAVAGLYSALSAMRSGQTSDTLALEKYNIDMEIYMEAVKLAEASIQDIQDEITYLKKYKENSVYANFNAYEIYEHCINILIGMDEEASFQDSGQEVQAVISASTAYALAAKDDGLYKEISKLLFNDVTRDIDSMELVIVEAKIDGTVMISAKYSDPQTAEILAGMTYRFVQDKVKQSSPQHKASVISVSAKQIMDINLNIIQESVNERLATCLETVQKQQNELQLLKSTPPQDPNFIKSIWKEMPRKMALGFILGLIAGVLWCFVVAIANDRITGREDFGPVNIPVLVELPSTIKTNKTINLFAKSSKASQSLEKSLQYFKAVLKPFFIDNAPQRLMLCGDIEKEEKNIELLAECIKESFGAEVCITGRIGKDAKAIEEFVDVSTAILIVTEGKSTFTGLVEDYEISLRLKKPFIGAVLI